MQEAKKYCYVEVRDGKMVIAKLPVYFYRRVWDFDRTLSHHLYFIKLTYVRVDASAVKYVSIKRYSFRFISTARKHQKVQLPLHQHSAERRESFQQVLCCCSL